MSSVASWPQGQLFPPEGYAVWLARIIAEIAEERAVSSRGRRVPRGLKRKMSGYPLRRSPVPTHPEQYPAKIMSPTK